ncbi:MAG: sulfotransferase [Pseudomonadota bacterium]|nr:sulfotransferase [Pseudomonadota bacterium]
MNPETGLRSLGTDAMSRLRLSSFDPDRLLRRARRNTGLNDFGDDALHESISRLFESYRLESRLTLIGRIAVLRDAQRLLETRLRLNAFWREHPDVGAQVIRRPIFITGLPRSGTTLLHGLLAQDPAHRVPLTWEVMFPLPAPRVRDYATDPRIRKTDRMLAWLDRLAPGFRVIHPVGATLPQECIAITSYTFQSPQFHTTCATPSYQAWLSGRERCPEYAFHRHFLQHLQWRRPGDRWVLKAPSHLHTLDALLATYPDATIVQTHRDPAAVIASVSSLTEVLQGAFSLGADRAAIGREALDRWSVALERATRSRMTDPRRERRFVDVRYRDLQSEPLRVVRELYSRLDMDLTGSVERRMRHFLRDNPKDKVGRHRYTLGDFGLDAGEVNERFSGYRERYDVGPDAA